MNRIIIISTFTFLVVNLSAQSWTYSRVESAFDGNAKVSSIVGEGYDFPYTKPMFVVNVFEGKVNDPNIYFTNVPSGACDNPMVLIKFDGDDTVYEPEVSISRDNEQWFLNFYEVEDVTEIEKRKIIRYVVPANKVVRLRENRYARDEVVLTVNANDTLEIGDFRDLQIGDFYYCRYKGKFYYTNSVYIVEPEKNGIETNEEIGMPVSKLARTDKKFQLFIKNLKTHSIMNVRLLSDCVKSDFKFSLKGSTVALNFVFSK